MGKRKRIARLPKSGKAVLSLARTTSGVVLKLPAIDPRDHLTLTLEDRAVGRHLKDELLEAHEPLGKVTRDTPRPDSRWTEAHVVSIDDDEEVWILDASVLWGEPALQASDIPPRDLVPVGAVAEHLTKGDFEGIPVLRRTTARSARQEGSLGGLRREADGVAFLIWKDDGRAIRLQVSELASVMPQISEVTGLGALMERAARRLADSSTPAAKRDGSESGTPPV